MQHDAREREQAEPRTEQDGGQRPDSCAERQAVTPGTVELRGSPPDPDQKRVRVGKELGGGDHGEGLWPRIDRAIARAMPKWPNCIVSPGRDPGTRWAQCVKPFSSGAILAVPLGLPWSDHFLKQDATNDRRGEDIAARVGREPALPLEQIERRLDGGSLEPGRRGELPDVHPLPQRGGGTEQLLGRCRKLAEP